METMLSITSRVSLASSPKSLCSQAFLLLLLLRWGRESRDVEDKSKLLKPSSFSPIKVGHQTNWVGFLEDDIKLNKMIR